MMLPADNSIPLYRESLYAFRSIATDKRDLCAYLKQVKVHDKDTFRHCVRVGILSLDLGVENEINSGLLHVLGYSGFLHDVGKKDIPLRVLAKEGPLDKLEKLLIKSHSRLGFLFAQEEEMVTAREVIVAHHEFKVNPYPHSGVDRRTVFRDTSERRNHNSSLSQLAQMVAAADVYDALRNPRAYKPALSLSEVERIMREQYKGDVKYVEQLMRRN